MMLEAFRYQHQNHEYWGPIYVKCLRLALMYHGNQTDDSTSAPYMFHLLRVSHVVNSYEEKCVAILHDIIEDTKMTKECLKSEGIPDIAITAITLLTHDKENSTYIDYVRKIRDASKTGSEAGKIAKSVKLADLGDNNHLHRDGYAHYDNKAISRLKRYRKAWRILMDLED